METLLSRMEDEQNMDMEFLSRVYPRLQVWLSWFNITQVRLYNHVYPVYLLCV